MYIYCGTKSNMKGFSCNNLHKKRKHSEKRYAANKKRIKKTDAYTLQVTTLCHAIKLFSLMFFVFSHFIYAKFLSRIVSHLSFVIQGEKLVIVVVYEKIYRGWIDDYAEVPLYKGKISSYH